MNAGGLLVLVILFALFWVLLIRPQRRRQIEQEQMIASLELGDEVVTAGGIYGEVVALEEDEVRLEIAPGTQVRVARRAVAGVLSGDEDDEAPEAEEEPPTRPEDEAADPSREERAS